MKTSKTIKNLILLIFVTGLICFMQFANTVIAAEPASEQITKIETSLYGLNYSNDTDETRLSRIEEEVFGSVNSKISIQERINKLNSALGLETLAEANSSLSDLYTDEAEGINYPAVDILELQLLGKNYKTDNIYKRLERLEGKVFGKAQKGDLAQRTDSLKAKISMMKPSSSLPKYQTGEYFTPNGSSNAGFEEYTEDDVIAKSRSDAKKRSRKQNSEEYNYDYNYGGSDMALQLAGLENTLFGQTFSYDPMAVRLNRLERRIFQRDFASDDEYARVARLQAASTAKKTAKYYDNNKFQKFASTGMQLGTFVLMILALIL